MSLASTKSGDLPLDFEKRPMRLLEPDVKYFKSPEGSAEFKKARLQYPETYLDKAYQSFLERTPYVEALCSFALVDKLNTLQHKPPSYFSPK